MAGGTGTGCARGPTKNRRRGLDVVLGDRRSPPMPTARLKKPCRTRSSRRHAIADRGDDVRARPTRVRSGSAPALAAARGLCRLRAQTQCLRCARASGRARDPGQGRARAGVGSVTRVPRWGSRERAVRCIAAFGDPGRDGRRSPPRCRRGRARNPGAGSRPPRRAGTRRPETQRRRRRCRRRRRLAERGRRYFMIRKVSKVAFLPESSPTTRMRCWPFEAHARTSIILPKIVVFACRL